MSRSITTELITAIRSERRVRLSYRRQSDEVVSLHEVAPIDIRTGWSAKTSHTLYLWAFCFAEEKAEMHLLSRIIAVTVLPQNFSPSEVLRDWPWPLPEAWTVEREWSWWFER